LGKVNFGYNLFAKISITHFYNGNIPDFPIMSSGSQNLMLALAMAYASSTQEFMGLLLKDSG
jgi:hypothetical protein